MADPDNSTLIGGFVSISGGFQSAEDSLQFTNQLGITGSYDAATGVLESDRHDHPRQLPGRAAHGHLHQRQRDPEPRPGRSASG